MSGASHIQWTEATWNSITGCTRVSEGCRFCYSERLSATRLAHQEKYRGVAEMRENGEPRWTGVIRCHEDQLTLPLKWQKPRMIFVNSMSDTFHADVPFEFLDKVFAIIGLCPQHTFQILTKRTERMCEYANSKPAPRILKAGRELMRGHGPKLMNDAAVVCWPPPNAWFGTSVEDQQRADERIPIQKRDGIDDDFTYSEGCGCQVTFFGASAYHTSRMLPGEACTEHTGRHQVAERDCLKERAKAALRHYLDPRAV